MKPQVQREFLLHWGLAGRLLMLMALSVLCKSLPWWRMRWVCGGEEQL